MTRARALQPFLAMEADQKDILAKRDAFKKAYLEWLEADPYAFQQAVEFVYEASMVDPLRAA